MSALLRAVSSPTDGNEFPSMIQLRDDLTCLGRSRKHCHVCFTSRPKVVSRLHASLVRSAGCGTWSVRDEGSLNGTYVNGRAVTPRVLTPLQPGDVISFGQERTIGGKLKYRLEMIEDEDTDVEEVEETNRGHAAGAAREPLSQGSDLGHPDLASLSLEAKSVEAAEVPLPPALAICNAAPAAATGGASCNSVFPSCGSASPASAMCSATESLAATARCLKRSRSASASCQAPENDCPFSSLMRIVKMHAKKLCLSGCKGNPEEVMAAASAACNAVAQIRSHHSAGSVPSVAPKCNAAGAAEDCGASALDCGDADSPAPPLVSPAPDLIRSSSAASAVSFASKMLTDDEEGLVGASPCQMVRSGVPCIPLSDQQSVVGCIPLVKPEHEPVAAKVVSQIAQMHEDPDSIAHSLSRRISELRSELTCPICQESFLHTNTLECGHSFCEPCVNAWLCKCLSCPICRASVDKPPIRSRTLDKAVEVTLRSNNQSAWQSLEERRLQYEEDLRKDLETKNKLEEALDKAMGKGLRCVHIGRPWSEREQCRFLKGLKCYRGAPREAYCKSVCLTPCFVQRASLKDLAIAARNVRLGSRNLSVDPNQMDAVQLRNRLNMFLKYC